MKHIDQSTAERLASYWAGECSPAEAAEIAAWVHGNAERAEAVALVHSGWEAAGQVPIRDDGEEFVRDLVASVGSTGEGSVGWHSSRSLRGWLGYSTVAAVLVAVLQLFRYTPVGQRSKVSSAPQFKEYTTAPGQRAVITLKDGTQVMLNVSSCMRVDSDYGANVNSPRVIDLTGEAQFIVTHDSKRPFTVRANGTLIRDLATTFVVRAYPGASATRVAIRDGRVSIQPPAVLAANAETINAGSAVTVSSDSKISVSAIASDDLYFGWTKGRLVLSKVPLAEALSELGRWYGMDFRVADSSMLSVNDISGAFPQSLTDERLRAIAGSIGARAQRSGTTVIFHPITN